MRLRFSTSVSGKIFKSCKCFATIRRCQSAKEYFFLDVILLAAASTLALETLEMYAAGICSIRLKHRC